MMAIRLPALFWLRYLFSTRLAREPPARLAALAVAGMM